MQARSCDKLALLLKKLLAESDVPDSCLSPPLRVPEIKRSIIVARDDLVRKYGEILDVRACSGRVMIVLAQARIPVDIALDWQGRIGGLRFRNSLFPELDKKALLQQLRALPGDVSMLVRYDGIDWFSVRSTAKLSVGSSFKLFILKAIDNRIREGTLEWEDLVRLTQDCASFGGIFNKWPLETPFTISCLVNAMIAASDNTATDMLIDVIGRDVLERLYATNRPFLKTRELYFLKFRGQRQIGKRYAMATVTQKRRILREFADSKIADGPSGFDPNAKIEWFFSVRELSDVMSEVYRAKAFEISGGPFEGEYDRVSFKAGREPGVLNYTVRIEFDRSEIVCSATWNYFGGVDEERFSKLVKGAIARCESEHNG